MIYDTGSFCFTTFPIDYNLNYISSKTKVDFCPIFPNLKFKC